MLSVVGDAGSEASDPSAPRVCLILAMSDPDEGAGLAVEAVHVAESATVRT